MRVSLIVLISIQLPHEVDCTVASRFIRRFTGIHRSLHCSHNVLYSLFPIPVWPNATVRAKNSWLNYMGWHAWGCPSMFTEQYLWLEWCCSTLWRLGSSQGTHPLATFRSAKLKRVLASVFAIVYIIVVGCYLALPTSSTEGWFMVWHSIFPWHGTWFTYLFISYMERVRGCLLHALGAHWQKSSSLCEFHVSGVCLEYPMLFLFI